MMFLYKFLAVSCQTLFFYVKQEVKLFHNLFIRRKKSLRIYAQLRDNS